MSKNITDDKTKDKKISKDEAVALEADVSSANEMWESISNKVKEKEEAFKKTSSNIASKAKLVANLNE